MDIASLIHKAYRVYGALDPRFTAMDAVMPDTEWRMSEQTAREIVKTYMEPLNDNSPAFEFEGNVTFLGRPVKFAEIEGIEFVIKVAE